MLWLKIFHPSGEVIWSWVIDMCYITVSLKAATLADVTWSIVLWQ